VSGPEDSAEDCPPRGRRLTLLSLAALGVVYGDVGTSPLYAIRECFTGEHGLTPLPEDVFGILSLVTWAILLIVCVKYLGFILRADNRGEGGAIALTALVQARAGGSPARKRVFLLLGLFAASLLYGDGMITPAISVMSALEGLEVAVPSLGPYVIALSVGVLGGLFLLQSRGTARIGSLFGPVMVVWFLVLAALGLRSVLESPGILAALDPRRGIALLARHGARGYLVLGAVFLCVTGTEALYADLGHFGRRPIRTAWYALVLPALLLNYYGQGARLLVAPGDAKDLFYAMAPAWGRLPLVLLATLATVIASQAVISGTFSLTRQAIRLGYCPVMQVEHTSAEQAGQVYLPGINALLLVGTVVLVLGFRSSASLAAAYGVAVTATMLLAGVLFFVVARKVWGWSLVRVVPLCALFMVVDLAFLGANLGKIAHGAWFPLALGLAAFTLLSTWKRGREILSARYAARVVSVEDLFERLKKEKIPRVPGGAVYMASSSSGVPLALTHNLAHNRVLHEMVVFLTVVTMESPKAPPGERVSVEALGEGFHRITALYGFMEDPDVSRILAAAKARGLALAPAETTFFLGREVLMPGRGNKMSAWRSRLFAFMARNTHGSVDFFKIPSDRVVELGARQEL
jgi:KUP system potassium uptake protein